MPYVSSGNRLLVPSSMGGLGTGGEGATEGEATESVVSICCSKVVAVSGTIQKLC